MLISLKISTHTSRVGCDLRAVVSCFQFKISTHTSRVGCDSLKHLCLFVLILISTHTSRVGCDPFLGLADSFGDLFLLTHPVWDVTNYAGRFLRLNIQFLLTHPVWDVTVP